MKRKPIVGETLYDLNVGNAARYRPQVLTPVIVRSVGRKYFVCSPADRPAFTTEYHLETWQQRTEYCKDHKLYETIKELEDDKESADIADRLRVIFSSVTPCRIPLEKLRAINAILG